MENLQAEVNRSIKNKWKQQMMSSFLNAAKWIKWMTNEASQKHDMLFDTKNMRATLFFFNCFVKVIVIYPWHLSLLIFNFNLFHLYTCLKFDKLKVLNDPFQWVRVGVRVGTFCTPCSFLHILQFFAHCVYMLLIINRTCNF